MFRKKATVFCFYTHKKRLFFGKSKGHRLRYPLNSIKAYYSITLLPQENISAHQRLLISEITILPSVEEA